MERSLRESRILVVAKEAGVAADLRDLLTCDGHIVLAVQDFAAAAYVSEVERFDIAIVDLQLGFEAFAEGLRAVDALRWHQPDVQMLLFSLARPDDGTRATLLELLPEGYGYVWVGDPDSNYLEVTRREVRRLTSERARRRCVVVTASPAEAGSTGIHLNEVLAGVVRRIVEVEIGYEWILSEDAKGRNLRRVMMAEIVIADVTGQPPNIFYALGMRGAMGGPCLVLARCAADIPPYLQHYAAVIYRDETAQDLEKLACDVKAALLRMVESAAGGRATRTEGTEKSFPFVDAGALLSPSDDSLRTLAGSR